MPVHRGLDRLALKATAHCLTGCGIGEILGLVIAIRLGWSTGATIALAVLLAFVFGYSLTLLPLLKAGIAAASAMKLALAADTISIVVMEIVDNAVMLVYPGAMNAGLGTATFWVALGLSLVLAFAVAYPVNRWLIASGRGHARVHGHHEFH
jgi:predicted Abi (CAAX) family protease